METILFSIVGMLFIITWFSIGMKNVHPCDVFPTPPSNQGEINYLKARLEVAQSELEFLRKCRTENHPCRYDCHCCEKRIYAQTVDSQKLVEIIKSSKTLSKELLEKLTL